MTARVLVIVPTHDHPWALDLSVESVLAQTLENLDIVIIGDGVGDDTRDVVASLLERDRRIRFIDALKSPSRAERVRHEVISSTDADVVAYLGDDDLFFPDHIQSMVALLDEHDFAHPVSVCLDEHDDLTAFPADLSDADCVEWHLHRGWNTIGLSGVAHTSEMYRRLPQGWTEPPEGWWSDHYFWSQIFQLPGVRLVTSARSTVVRTPSAWRSDQTPASRRLSLERWLGRIERPEYAEEWNRLVGDAVRRSAVTNSMWTVRHHRTIGELRELLDQQAKLLEDLQDSGLAPARAELAAMRSSRTWRLRDRLVQVTLLRALFARPAPSGRG